MKEIIANIRTPGYITFGYEGRESSDGNLYADFYYKIAPRGAEQEKKWKCDK